jgi:hypothetical protein
MFKTQSPLPARSAQTMLSPGDVISDRYRLERDLARTEVGVVYDATDTKSNREVAVEVAS